MDTTCTKCGCDLLHLDLQLRLEGKHHSIFCPVCGNCVVPKAQFPGAFYDDSEGCYIIWQLNLQRTQHASKSQNFSDSFGLTVAGKSLNPYDICYPKVIIFQHEGELAIPFTGIRPEFHRYLQPFIHSPAQWLSPRYRFQPALLGDFNPSIQLSALTSQTQPGSQADTYTCGTALNLWPNFRREGWRNYFIYFVSTDPNVKVQSLRVIGENGEQRVFDGPVPRGEVDFVPGFIEISVLDSVGTEYWSCFKVEFKDGESLHPVATIADVEAIPLLALDFGTSNTCFALSLPDEDTVRVLNFRDRTKRIIRGLYVGDSINFTWFPDAPQHEETSELPSELIFATEISKIGSDIRQFRPIVNYTIPPPTRYREGEEKYVLGDFKWERSLLNSQFKPFAFDLQFLYLTLAFRLALAEIVSNPLCHRFDRIGLVVTCPLAFSAAQRDKFRDVLNQVQTSISEQTGITLILNKIYDESHAGAAGSGQVSGTTQTIYVDIGGGTTDFGLFRFEEIDGQMQEQAIYLDSMQYAGDDIWRAITTSELSDWPLIRFEREARFRSANSIFDSQALEPFKNQSHKLDKAKRCVQRFIGGQIEFIARMIGARQQSVGSEQQDSNLGLYLLGNGWRFVEVLLDSEEDNASLRIAEHVKILLEERLAAYAISSPPLVVTYPTGNSISAKTIVAVGAATLYIGERRSRVIPEAEFTLRTFLGSDLVVTTSQRQVITWYEQVPYELNTKASVQSVNYQIHPDFAFETEQVDSVHIETENLLLPLLSKIGGRACVGKNAFAYYLERWHKEVLAK